MGAPITCFKISVPLTPSARGARGSSLNKGKAIQTSLASFVVSFSITSSEYCAETARRASELLQRSAPFEVSHTCSPNLPQPASKLPLGEKRSSRIDSIVKVVSVVKLI